MYGFSQDEAMSMFNCIYNMCKLVDTQLQIGHRPILFPHLMNFSVHFVVCIIPLTRFDYIFHIVCMVYYAMMMMMCLRSKST